MTPTNRRAFLRAAALASGAMQLPAAAEEAEVARDVTRRLARYVVNARASDLPASVRKEGARTLLNWVGCAVGGSRHETVDIAIAALSPFSGRAQATMLGRASGWT